MSNALVPSPIMLLALLLAVVGCAETAHDTSGRGAGAYGTTDPGFGGSAGSVAVGGDGTGSAVTTLPGVDGEECTAVSEQAEAEFGQVDIVWIIDASCSMFDEQMAVQDNINRFAADIGGTGLDVHVVILTDRDLVAAGTPLATAGNYMFVPSDVGSTDALQILVNSYPSYQGFLRPGAFLHLIAVTDDESDYPGGAVQFMNDMRAVSNRAFSLHAIASESVNGSPCAGTCGIPFACGAAAVGTTYYSLADMTGGQKISICTADWSQVFGPLKDAVIASVPLPCNYTIPPAPSGQILDGDKVNVEYVPVTAGGEYFPKVASELDCGNNEAWYYDDPAAPSQVLLCPLTCERVAAGGTLNIAFGCASILLE